LRDRINIQSIQNKNSDIHTKGSCQECVEQENQREPDNPVYLEKSNEFETEDDRDLVPSYSVKQKDTADNVVINPGYSATLAAEVIIKLDLTWTQFGTTEWSQIVAERI